MGFSASRISASITPETRPAERGGLAVASARGVLVGAGAALILGGKSKARTHLAWIAGAVALVVGLSGNRGVGSQSVAWIPPDAPCSAQPRFADAFLAEKANRGLT